MFPIALNASKHPYVIPGGKINPEQRIDYDSDIHVAAEFDVLFVVG